MIPVKKQKVEIRNEKYEYARPLLLGKKNKWVYPGLAGFKWVAFPKSNVESRKQKFEVGLRPTIPMK